MTTHAQRPLVKSAKHALSPIMLLIALMQTSGCLTNLDIKNGQASRVAELTVNDAAKIIKAGIIGTDVAEGVFAFPGSAQNPNKFDSEVNPQYILTKKFTFSETGQIVFRSVVTPSGRRNSNETRRGTLLHENKYIFSELNRVVVRAYSKPMRWNYLDSKSKGDYLVQLEWPNMCDIFVLQINREALPALLLAVSRLAPQADFCVREKRLIEMIQSDLLTPNEDKENSWMIACGENTGSSYEKYLKKHPVSHHTQEASRRLLSFQADEASHLVSSSDAGPRLPQNVTVEARSDTTSVSKGVLRMQSTRKEITFTVGVTKRAEVEAIIGSGSVTTPHSYSWKVPYVLGDHIPLSMSINGGAPYHNLVLVFDAADILREIHGE